jgi:GntR family transcriptional regulator
MVYKIPKYYQIEQDIVCAIKAGELQPGDKVDSESVLKKKYNCSTITVRRAFGDLINEGYLVGVQGVGTFVAKKQMIRGLTSISFSDELLQQGYTIDIKIVSIEETVNFSIAEKLGIEKKQPIICIKRVRLANGEPMAYHTSYIDSRKLTLKAAQNIENTKSFYKTLADNGIVPKWVNENYSVKAINDSMVASLMNISKGTYTFFAKRTAFDELDQIVEYSETYFNKDIYSVTVNIKI